MFRENLAQLRKLHNLSQEELAEKVGVSRQTLSKWETGESVPDIEKCDLLAQIFDVTLDNLVHFTSPIPGLVVPPRGKHVFGLATMDEDGRIQIPIPAQNVFLLKPGDRLLVLGDESQGLALMRESDIFKRLLQPFLPQNGK